MVDHGFILHPQHWRERAEETRIKAESFGLDVRQKRKLLRIAEEYERLAERAAQWQTGSQAQE